jgi:hypothetical protein
MRASIRQIINANLLTLGFIEFAFVRLLRGLVAFRYALGSLQPNDGSGPRRAEVRDVRVLCWHSIEPEPGKRARPAQSFVARLAANLAYSGALGRGIFRGNSM